MEQFNPVKPAWWRLTLGAILCFVASFDITWFIQTVRAGLFSPFLLIVVLLAAIPSFYGAVLLFSKRQLNNWIYVGIAYAILVLIIFLGRNAGVGWATALPIF